jgi:transketolase
MEDKLIEDLKKKVHSIKTTTLDMCITGKQGHISSSFSCAEILSTLYFGNILNYDSKDPHKKDRDRFILSKGHASPLLYAILSEAGFFPKDWLSAFCSEEAKFGIHLQQDIPGVEYSTGSLGHGLGFGTGIALAAKMNRKDFFTFVLLGDGECQEGSVWEAAMFAGQNNLNNLIAIIDRNWLGILDYTERGVGLEPFEDKWKSFGWEVKRINGNSIKDILDALYEFRSFKKQKPLMIIADTVKGNGISFMEHSPLWHGAAPKGENAEKAKRELKIEGEQL